MEYKFVKSIKHGTFKVPICTKCNAKAWPPSPTCPLCYSKTSLKKVCNRGILLEFATSYVRDHEGIFGIVQMDGFRLVGSFDNAELVEGMSVHLTKCGIQHGTPYYLFVPDHA